MLTHPHDSALCNLTRIALTGDHVDEMELEELREFNKKVGDLLADIPQYVRRHASAPLTIMTLINELDPSGNSLHWGYWCTQFADDMGTKLPERPLRTGKESSCTTSSAKT